MLDHLSIQCADPAASAAFYDSVLATLGGERVMQFGDVIGYGIGGRPTFWIGPLTTGEPNREAHIAFEAPNRAAVDAWFEAAKAAGAEVLHEPRVWPEYHPTYYGAFVRDPDGNNVEAVLPRPRVAPPPGVLARITGQWWPVTRARSGGMDRRQPGRAAVVDASVAGTGSSSS